MSNIELRPFKRVESKRGFDLFGLLIKLLKTLKESYPTLILCFLCSRSSISDSIYPFGLAFLAALFGAINPVMLSASVILSLISAKLPIIYIVKYGGAICFYSLFALRYPSHILANTHKRAIFTVFSIILSGLLINLGGTLLLYDMLLLILEAAVAFVSVYAFSYANRAWRIRYKAFTQQELLGFITMIGVIFLGFSGNFTTLRLDIAVIAAVFITLLMGHAHGMALSSAVGTLLGLIVSITHYNIPAIVSSFALSGFLCGIFGKHGRIFAFASFLAGNSLVTLYINGSNEVLISIYNILAAGIIFMLLPSKAVNWLKSRTALKQNGDVETYKQDIASDIVKVSDSFKELSSVFLDLCESIPMEKNTYVAALFERVAKRVCKNCSFNKICWGREFNSTYNEMLRLLNLANDKGYIDTTDISSPISEKCRHLIDFANCFNSTFELYRIDKLWEHRVLESRYLIARQLSGVSAVLDNLSMGIQEKTAHNPALESSITKRLSREGIVVRDIRAYQDQNNRTVIDTILEPCGGFLQCKRTCPSIISHVAGIKFELSGDIDCSRCTHRYIQSKKYSVQQAFRQVSSQSQCGDSFDSVHLYDGCVVVAISDGMGTGKKASNESQATIKLLKKLLLSGFSKNTAIELINSVLVAKSAETSFATIDMCLLDMTTGNCEFVKIGAASSYVRKDRSVSVITSASLPCGMDKNADIQSINVTVEQDDMIVMVSDGIEDCGPTGWISRCMEDYDGDDQEEMCDIIIEKAKDFKSEIDDDMTVFCCKIA